MKVFVAGGAHSFVHGIFQKNLNDAGMQIIGHASTECRSYTGIPVGAEGLIVIKDMINHALSDKTVADAKSRGLPHALVERKWSKARSVLVKTGFIQIPATNIGIKAVDTKPVVDFILEIRKVASRTATLSEVRKRFPLITGEEYNVACGMASKHADVVVMSDKEVATHIHMVMAEDYGLVRDENALFLRTQTTFPEIATFITPSRVRAAIQDALDSWRRDHQVRDAAIYTFAVSRYRQFQKEGTGWIGSGDLVSIVKPIFGSGGGWNWFCKARAEVYGQWALRLSHLVEALGEFQFRNPGVQSIPIVVARAEIDAGRLKGFKQSHIYRTSAEAIEEYVKDYPQAKPVEYEADPFPSGVEIMPKPVLTVQQEASPLPALVLPQAPLPAPPVQVDEGHIAKFTPPNLDTVGMADLIESGIKIQLDQFVANLEAKLTEDSGKNAKDLAAIKHDVDVLVNGVTATMSTLCEAVKKLGELVLTTNAEVKTLRDQREAVKSDPASVKALNLGHTLLNAKGAEVRFTLGDFKG